MPTTVSRTTGGTAYASALIGDYQTLHVKIDPASLPANAVDAQGILKPNVPLSLLGVTLAGITNEVPCVTVEGVKIAADNQSATLTAAADVFVACATTGVLNRDIMEDVLGRVLSSAEIAALNGPNSKLVLSLT
jgi:hypothetical protein